nr:hypothetical protein [uncultured Flavobacterium sp.]
MKHVFSRNDDYKKIAFLNWRISTDDHIINLLNIADGFLRSAGELSNVCLKDNSDKKADIIIFPILFNLNHGIELYLKSLNWTLNKLLGYNRDIEGNHNILQLYNMIYSKFKKYQGNIKCRDFLLATKELKVYIDELYEKIGATELNDKMDFSRYSFKKGKNSENHFYAQTSENIEIDLENLLEIINCIKDKLDSICKLMYHQELNNDY